MTIGSEIKHISETKMEAYRFLSKIRTAAKNKLVTGMLFRSGLMKAVSVYSPKRGAFSELADEVNSKFCGGLKVKESNWTECYSH